MSQPAVLEVDFVTRELHENLLRDQLGKLRRTVLDKACFAGASQIRLSSGCAASGQAALQREA